MTPAATATTPGPSRSHAPKSRFHASHQSPLRTTVRLGLPLFINFELRIFIKELAAKEVNFQSFFIEKFTGMIYT